MSGTQCYPRQAEYRYVPLYPAFRMAPFSIAKLHLINPLVVFLAFRQSSTTKRHINRHVASYFYFTTEKKSDSLRLKGSAPQRLRAAGGTTRCHDGRLRLRSDDDGRGARAAPGEDFSGKTTHAQSFCERFLVQVRLTRMSLRRPTAQRSTSSSHGRTSPLPTRSGASSRPRCRPSPWTW
jgi:hypothetical protein